MTTQALTVTITRETIGMAAAMIVLAVLGGTLLYFIDCLVCLIGWGKDNWFFNTVAILRWPLALLGVIGGAYLGYRLMR